MANKSLFNFYLDNDEKEAAMKKLTKLTGDKPKGQLAAFLRVQIKSFLATPDDKINPTLIKAINAEYEYSQKLNKRSKL